MNDLSDRARAWGIESGYHDVFGNWHAASADTLQRLVEGLSGGRDAPPAVNIAPMPAQPMRCWQGDGRRLWGLSAQLYALRSRRDWGIGDFTDLARLLEVAAACGASAVGLNPLHALFPDKAEQASPYAPNSRVYLNPLYIDVEAIPEFPGLNVAGLADVVAELRAHELVDYAGVAAAKLKGLHLAYERFAQDTGGERRADFERFRAEQGDALLRFACFEVLRQRYAPKTWREWPDPWRKPDLAALEDFRSQQRSACEFQEFLQWTANRQLRTCLETARRRDMPVGLYIDVAVGIDPVGADAWSAQDVIVSTASVGAPPDEFNPRGQDWGLAPFNPSTVSQDDFAPLRQLMRATMRHAGAIRLDHVLGLKRIFMVPHGMGPASGAYVDFPFEPLLRVIGEESCRYRCIVIGEDLGTVPEGFRETLAKWGLWSYRVMLFEREADGSFRPPEWYPADALATFNTHDLPSFRGWLTAHDLRVKRGLGIDPGESDEARALAQHMLRQALSQRAPESAPDDVAAVASYLGATPCRLVVVALEDLLGQIEQINIPGTVHQHPNWRRKLTVSVEDLGDHGALRRVAEAFGRTGRSFAG